MMIATVICLIILELMSHCACVHSKVIIINSNNGNDSTECCVYGECPCSSLFMALLNIDNNTLINITSKSVALNNATTMGSGNLANITITGNNVTIVCNNSGSVYCESCDNVMIEGITWDKCGDPNGTNDAGVTFNRISNILLVNCAFKYSQLAAVSISLSEVSNNVTVVVYYCNFSSNIPVRYMKVSGILSITRSSPRLSSSLDVTITFYKSFFYNNGYLQNSAPILGISPLYIDINDNSVVNCNININKTAFVSNRNAVCLNFNVTKLLNVQLAEILVLNNTVSGIIGTCEDTNIGLNTFSYTTKIILSVISSTFSGNNGSDMFCLLIGDDISIMINDSNFTDSKPAVDTVVGIVPNANKTEIVFYRVQFNNNDMISTLLVDQDPRDLSGAVSIYSTRGDVIVYMYQVNFTSNQNLGNYGGALYIIGSSDIESNNHSVTINNCQFVNNRSPGHGAALFIYTVTIHCSVIQIMDTVFDQNIAGSSIVYITQGLTQFGRLQLSNLTFTNNTASSMYLAACYSIEIFGPLLFENNTAENGGALYLTQGSIVTINKADVWFIANTATLNGGAIYMDLLSTSFSCDIKTFKCTGLYIFINNTARIVGNSIYFNVPRSCLINTNYTDSDSILYIPCQFNYSQLVNGKMMNNISCDLDYTLLNGTGAPVVTSPHEVRLYFPYVDGLNISTASNYNTYFVRNNILGHQVSFTGAVFDYFGKLANPTQFGVQLQGSNEYSLIGGDRNHVLTQSIDNLTMLSVSFRGKRIKTAYINLTVTLLSLSYSLNKINATLIVELIPCVDHPGYVYSEESQACVCYHINVKCYADGNEIKRGYWIGGIAGKATTSLCPNHYCKFTDHKETSEGYSELPSTTDAQCNHHRIGRACGKCKPGYTLSYDFTDCISEDQCGAGWTALVIILTCLYWIAIVAGVFGLMYFKRHISLGYLYGLIYYYSMVGVLLDNNPYISYGGFQFISILSSFAQLTPQFLGRLCFVKGLSGIDQLFIHYSHAVAVSLLLLLIVVAARCSARIAVFVSRCIIRVICLLILLSYTSIASTSLQLLQPLRFTDIKQWYTYSSPHIQYFRGRHIAYSIVAIICELVVGIGLPLLLLLEPVLSRKINFIKIKPLLDQFQGCYKDKYRWFAAYYLICRQVIFLIVYIFNSDYYNMLFYLQTACVVIAMIHMCIHPYHNDFLNAMDGIMLLLIVLEVNINTFPFLKNVTIEIALIIVMLPLILLSTVVIKSMFYFCLKKRCYHHYSPINDDDDDDDERGANVAIRNADPINELDEPPAYQGYNAFQEPLLNLVSDNDNN